MVLWVWGAGAAALVLSTMAVAAQGKPSFDCAKAKEDVEKAICASTELSNYDRDIAAAYAEARKKLDPAAQRALKSDQEMFLAAREIALTVTGSDLAGVMKERLALLRGLSAGPAGQGPAAFLGEWRNENGSVEITGARYNLLSIKIQSAAVVTGKWVCEVEALADVKDGRIAFTEEKVRITLSRAGGALRIDERTPPNESQPPYCGNNGGISGHYFKVK